MAVFKAALVNEIEKLSKKKKAWVAVILSLAVIVAGQLVILAVRSGFGLRGVGSGEFPLLVLSLVVNTILPLFAALVAIDSFSGESAQNTLRITLTRPVSRLKIFSAKIGAITLFLLAALFLLLIFSLLAGLLFNANSLTWPDFFRIVLSFLVSLLPLVILALGIVLLTNLVRSGITVFFLAILAFLLLKVLGLVFSTYADLLPTASLDWYNLWLAGVFPWTTIVRQFLLMLGYGVMFFVAGFYLFDQKEL
ncbi:ABC-2 family transporter protein [Acididesulfobacillus acetoxydans]|uniref:ABC-2 family transporter protein n=1 Tax=Acididesulfobacillus acetoxydans TaxID=1561005 RepID=A0A8S0X3N6_9FIRM|nr:ABC transporter permease [Acididesulfobacillus acetoxydans]CAA7600250.1 ABC-2 family transporter protein [Acididesulfobacillus acetoxydans]CEJ09628.1 Membrane spanning protein [Acididesulfobacillus acetoxydans]